MTTPTTTKPGQVFIEMSGNFAPEWRQLVDAIQGEGDEVHDANISDAARELVEAVLFTAYHAAYVSTVNDQKRAN